MILLKTEKRGETREDGFIPAVFYGEGIKNINLKVSEKEFMKGLKEAGESSLISLDIAGKEHQVFIQQIAKDPLTDKVIHIDFFHPSLKKKLTVVVPLMFIGEAPACVTLGGVLIRGVDQVEVKGLAKDLPKEIEVDISGLNTFEDKILIKDLTLPEEVEILNHEKDDAICHVAEPKQEKEPEPEPEVTEEAEEGVEKEEAPVAESEPEQK